MSVEQLYPLWRTELIEKTRRELSITQKALETLQDQTTIYARSIAALAEMRRQALAVYENSPEALGDAQ